MTAPLFPRQKKTTALLLGLGVALLASLIVWDISHPSADEEADAYMKKVEAFSPEQRRQASSEERAAMRAEFDKLPPATRQKVTNRFVQQGVAQMRKEMAKLSPAERKAKIDAAVTQMQENFDKIPDEERKALRDRLQDPQARSATSSMMATMQATLTLEERELFDPLIREMIFQIENLGSTP